MPPSTRRAGHCLACRPAYRVTRPWLGSSPTRICQKPEESFYGQARRRKRRHPEGCTDEPVRERQRQENRLGPSFLSATIPTTRREAPSLCETVPVDAAVAQLPRRSCPA